MLHTKSKIVSSKIKSKKEDYIFTSVHAKATQGRHEVRWYREQSQQRFPFVGSCDFRIAHCLSVILLSVEEC